MRITSLIILLPIVSCNQQPNTQNFQSQIDSMKSHLSQTYKPGFGEFMSSIQIHHEKLWFAGQNKNWKLADFEVNEITEALQDIRNYCTDRPEVQALPMINAAMDSIKISIQQQNITSFKTNFILLTTTCNNCHKATKHEFNVIKLPEIPPFSNQEFKAP